MKVMTINEIKKMFEEVMQEEDITKEDSFFHIAMNYSATNFIHEERELSLIRIRDEVVDKKRKTVRSSFVVCEFAEGLCVHATVSINANANTLKANNIKFSNFRNVEVKETTGEDIFAFQIANTFFVKFPEANNLLGMAFNVRNDQGKLLKKRIGMDELNAHLGI